MAAPARTRDVWGHQPASRVSVRIGGPVATEPKMQFSRAKKLSLAGSAQPLFVEMFGAI
jgi:hypothetical protein